MHLVVMHHFAQTQPRLFSPPLFVLTVYNQRDRRLLYIIVCPIKGSMHYILPCCCSPTGDVALILFILTIVIEID